MIGAFSRTRVVRKMSNQPTMAMTKWWKKKRPAEAEITMHLSPYEQQALIPWIKTFPKKAVARVPVYLWPVGTLAFIYGIMASTEMRDQAEDLEHRF
jgi:hypothetical protein